VAPQSAQTAAPERTPPPDHAATVRQAIEALARQLQVSRQKDTTQDYQPARQPPGQRQGFGVAVIAALAAQARSVRDNVLLVG
jgi:hypothetical protein